MGKAEASESPYLKPETQETSNKPKFRPETLELIQASHGVLALFNPEIYGHECWVAYDKIVINNALIRLNKALVVLGFPADLGADREQKPWREVLGDTWPELPNYELLALAEYRYQALWKMIHPNNGGICSDFDRLAVIQVAIRQARKELG